MKPILAIDPGNIQSAFCLIDPDGYKPLDFAKQENEQIRKVVNRYCEKTMRDARECPLRKNLLAAGAEAYDNGKGTCPFKRGL